jgi:hypothetical protein
LQEAAANQLTHAEFLELILQDELNIRHQRQLRIPTKSDTQSDPYRTACRFISDSCRSEATLGGDL